MVDIRLWIADWLAPLATSRRRCRRRGRSVFILDFGLWILDLKGVIAKEAKPTAAIFPVGPIVGRLGEPPQVSQTLRCTEQETTHE
jgi:hypothetical protein